MRNLVKMTWCEKIHQALGLGVSNPRTTNTRWLKFFAAQIQISIPSKYLGFGYKGLVFFRNYGWLMENMDRGLLVPKGVLINQAKIHQMLQNWFVQIVCPSPKVWDWDEKGLHWASIVRALNYQNSLDTKFQTNQWANPSHTQSFIIQFLESNMYYPCIIIKKKETQF